MEKIQIYVVSHKNMNLKLPQHCSLIQVNAENNNRWENCIHDNDYEDNISNKNNSYCELTALYHMWKYCNADIVGLFHYRRYFSGRTKLSLINEVNRFCKKGNLVSHIINENDIKQYLKDSDIVLAIPNCPYPAYVYEDLQRFVSIKDISILIKTVKELYPDFYDDLLSVLREKNISYCNMFITRNSVMVEYCEWLFSVLEDIEEQIDISDYDLQHQRIFGYFSEILLNVYVKKRKLKVTYVYKIDMIEDKGSKLVKYYLNQGLNYCLAIIGIYPRYKWRKLLQNRYIHLNLNTHETVTGNKNSDEIVDEYASYITKIGGRNVMKGRIDQFPMIRFNIMEVTVNVLFLKDLRLLSECEHKIFTVRNKQPFGYSEVYRICSFEKIDDYTKEEMLNSGIVIDEL